MLLHFVLQHIGIIDPQTLNQMDVSSKPEKIKMDALCELTAKIQQNPHPGNEVCFCLLRLTLDLTHVQHKCKCKLK